MTEKPMTVAEVANFLRRSIKSVKRLPIPFSRVGKGVVFHPCTKADAKYWEEQGRNLQNEPV